MKIRSARLNNRRRMFELTAGQRSFQFPYAKAQPSPTPADPVVELSIDRELGSEAVTYRLDSGREGTVHIEQVLEYDQDPGYLRDLLLYRVTLEAQARLEASELSRREIIRRLGTSPAQFYRLLDPTNRRKSLDKMLALLAVLDCEVDLVVRPKSA